MRVTINNINAALKSAGIDGEILKGQGYYYFCGPDFDLTDERGVYGVLRLGELSIERWVAEAKEKITK